MSNKASAGGLSQVGYKYTGRSYEEMDCQAFVEQCLADVGILIDLKGSNAWYRKIRSEGWVGSPEECKARFGSVPRGAFLFIHAFDGDEEARGYHDGLGNASHIGIKTGTGEGAIHSSQSRGGVCESKFRDRTIPNGGWNVVGLWTRMTYGEEVDRILDGGVEPEPSPEPTPEPTPTPEWATVFVAPGRKPWLHLRKEKSTSSKVVDDVPNGAVVQVIRRENDWTRAAYTDPNGATWVGWIYQDPEGRFGLIFQDSDGGVVPEPEDPDKDARPEPPEGGDQDPADDLVITIRVSLEQAQALLRACDTISWQLVQAIGRAGG